MNCNIIPQPKKLTVTSGTLRACDCYLTLTYRQFVPKSVELLSGGGTLPITLKITPSLAEEHYILTVSEEGALVKAATPKAAYYALCTLKQLFDLNGGEISGCVVDDEPTMATRGVSDDISRGQISTMQNFKDIIRRLSLIKCNLYMPYIEDVLKLKCLPESGKFSDPTQPEEWKELIAYAKDYYVDIIPIVNTLGHWDKNASLECFRDYILEDKDSYALDIRKPEVQEMVSKMVDEVADIFEECGAIHVGGDEANPYTRYFSKEEAAQLYTEHYHRLYEQLKARNMKMLMYSDMYTPVWGEYQLGINRIEEMPDDIGFVYWDYACRARYWNIEELVERKKNFYISPATHSWSRFLPQHYLSWLNSKSMAAVGAEHAQGIIMSAWCDNGLSLREENWMGLYSGALFSWNCHSEIPFDDTVHSFFQLFFGIDVDMERYHDLMDYDLSFTSPTYDEEIYGRSIEFWYCDRQDGGTRLFQEFWKDATLPVDPDLKSKLTGARGRFERGLAYFSSLTPARNFDAYNAYLFDIKRSLAASKKVELMLDRPYRSREEAMADVPAIDSLIEEVTALMEENEKLWFDCNRQSEWDSAKCKYLDLIDSLHSLKRYCLYAKKMRLQKRLFLNV